jgi:hypothetical protein
MLSPKVSLANQQRNSSQKVLPEQKEVQPVNKVEITKPKV